MIRSWLRNFMVGRYGPDQLNIALIILALLLSVITRFVNLEALIILSYILLILTVLRMLSKNISKRRSENDKFLRYWSPIKQKTKKKINKIKSMKTHKFFKCPSCKNTLRIPRGKGTVQITCPKCGERFTKKT